MLADPNDKLYLCAETHSNILGEPTATAELLRHILYLVNQETLKDNKQLAISLVAFTLKMFSSVNAL